MNIKRDELYMGKAIAQARASLQRGDYPVGAVLLINGELVGEHNNSLRSQGTWGGHAETQLLLDHSKKIKDLKMEKKGTRVELYSTLEPCLMCLGTALLHRVDRVIFACHDPRGGATSVSLENLPGFYHTYWPEIVSGIQKEESYSMLHDWMLKYQAHNKVWIAIRGEFEAMKKEWG